MVDAWAQLGNSGWEWEKFSKSLSKAYTLTPTPAAAETPGTGPLQVSLPDTSDNDWPHVWADTLRSLGLEGQGDVFAGAAYGAITNPDTIHPATKQRSYAANAYLGPARGRENLTIITKAIVQKIVFNHSESGELVAQSVNYTQNGENKTVNTRKEVIITAGAINSPKVLELSGVGDAERLKKLGIESVIDNPYVGENLQNHVMCGLSFEVKEGVWTMDGLARQDPAALGAAMEAYGKQSGPFARSGTNASAQLPFPGIQTEEGKADLEQVLKLTEGHDDAKTTPAFAESHAKLVKTILSSPEEASGFYISFPGFASFNGDGTMAPPPAGAEGYFSLALLLAHPLSRGSVHITSATGYDEQPEIDPRYLSHPLDLEVLARHLRFLQTIATEKPLSNHLKPEGKRNPGAPSAQEIQSLETAKEYVKRTAVGAHHFMGTCSMMPRELGGVVDTELRLHGCRNLRVCDASVIPLSPRTNPQATVYGVAEHAAGIIKSSLN